jgi:hypothetical protein
MRRVMKFTEIASIGKLVTVIGPGIVSGQGIMYHVYRKSKRLNGLPLISSTSERQAIKSMYELYWTTSGLTG